MNDNHLSDHEWKLKQAQEGRAVYVPGKPDAAIRTEREERERKGAKPVSVRLARAEASKVADVIEDRRTMLGQIADVLDFLHYEMTGGLEGCSELGISATIALMHKAIMLSMEKSEGQLAQLEDSLRTAVSSSIQKEADNAA